MEEANPLVSVILPFYNASFLEAAIQSILNQTFRDFELILIDNESTDDSLTVAQAYCSHANVRLIQEPKRGVVYAANAGIEQCKGEFIARMDADDISYSSRLEHQLNKFKSRPHLDVVSGLISYKGDAKNEGFKYYVSWLNTIQSEKDISLNQFVEFPLANPSIMFRKEVFTKYGIYSNGSFPEDYELFLRFQENSVLMEKVDHLVLEWRDSDTRLTRTNPIYRPDAFFSIKAKYLAKWLKKNNVHHPEIIVWGAGRLSRRRSDLLLSEGIVISDYIDVKKQPGILHFSNIPTPDKCFIVSYVSNRGARDEIRAFLNEQGYVEGKNYILAA
ncbi:MAG: glycosyltransferase [Ekhidna sp.]